MKRVAAALYRGALRLQPRWIREGWGEEMLRDFVAGLDDRSGRVESLAWTGRNLVDVMRNGLRERRRGTPPPPGLPAPTGGGGMGHRDVWMDARVAVRSLRRTPGFTLAAVAILALGIGANTALFSALRGALLTPPPFPDPERIVLLDLTDSSTVEPERSGPMPWSYPKYRVLAEADELPLTARAAFAVRNLTLTGAGDAAVLPVEVATPEYLDVLGVTPVQGRGFAPDDDREGAALVALVSHGEWSGRFGGADDLVGRDVTLEGRPVTVVGILPDGFTGLSGQGRYWITPHAAAQLIRPFMVTAAQAHWMQGVGRMGTGVGLETVRDAMAGVGRAAEAVAPSDDPTTIRSGTARSLMDVRVGERARRSLLVLVLASGLLLLVACANLGGLLLARSTARRRESAVRAALGAGRWRVARGHLVESLVLALAGGAASVGVAWAASTWLTRVWPSRSLSDAWNVDVVGLGAAAPGLWTVAFAAGLSVVVGLLLGLIPVVASARARPADHLREGTVGRRATSGRGVRGALVAGEIAVALVLIVGAGLLLRSLQALNDVDRGYTPGRLLTFQLRTPASSVWADDPAAFHEQVETRLAALPEVQAVGMGCVAPVSGHCMITGVRQAGERTWSEGDRPGIGVHYVTDAWFETLGVETLRGRTFDSRDQRGSAPAVVLSEAAARELFPDGDAVGNRIAMGVTLTSESSGATAEVVGVVGDVLYDRPENGLMAEAYISHRQEDSYGTFVIRTRGEPLAVVPALRAAIREIEPDAPLMSLRTVAAAEASVTADTRMVGLLLLAFAGLALLLACTGVWAAVAFTVSRRTREFGLRLALGARPGQVVGSVVRGGLLTALLGIGVGIGAAWYGARILDALLFEVGVGDPVAFAGGAGVLLAVALAAAWLPARRVTRVDPVSSLRSE